MRMAEKTTNLSFIHEEDVSQAQTQEIGVEGGICLVILKLIILPDASIKLLLN